MSSVIPGQFMKLPSGAGLAVGAPADLVLFERDGSSVRLLQTYKDGELVYRLEEQTK
jgi:dihydroorotase-like cyclic amidohydrolase